MTRTKDLIVPESFLSNCYFTSIHVFYFKSEFSKRLGPQFQKLLSLHFLAFTTRKSHPTLNFKDPELHTGWLGSAHLQILCFKESGRRTFAEQPVTTWLAAPYMTDMICVLGSGSSRGEWCYWKKWKVC